MLKDKGFNIEVNQQCIKDQNEFYEANTIALHKDAKIKTLFKNKHKK